MPQVPPEKRPSVMSPTDSPRPWPISADVGASISCMPGPALRALVADDDDVAGVDLLGHDRVHHRGLGVEHARRAGDRRVLEAGDLGDAAFGREVALEDREMALRVHRVRPRPDHVLVGARLVGHVGELLGDRAAGDRHAVAVQQAVRRAASSAPAARRRRGGSRRRRSGPRASGRTAPARAGGCARSRRSSTRPRRPRRSRGSAAPRWSSRRSPSPARSRSRSTCA